jgi:hypothetical protein
MACCSPAKTEQLESKRAETIPLPKCRMIRENDSAEWQMMQPRCHRGFLHAMTSIFAQQKPTKVERYTLPAMTQ